MNRRGRWRRSQTALKSGAGGAFSPRALPNLTLWLRADQGLTLVGTHISAWADLSGNGNNFSQTTDGQRPIYSATSGPNGQAGATFTSTSSQMMTCINNITTGVPSCMVAVFKHATDPGIAALLVSQKLGFYSLLAVSEWGVLLTQQVLYPSGVLVNGTSYSLIANQHAVNNVDMYQNGVLSTQINGTGMANRTGTAIGADPSGVQFFNGTLSEMLLFSTDLTATNLASLRSYLNARYGVS